MKTTLSFYCGAIAATFLTGCASNAEIAQDRCTQAGFTRGTNQYASCYVTVVQQEELKGMAMMGIGLGMMEGGGNQQVPQTVRTYTIDGRIYNCSTLGGSTICN